MPSTPTASSVFAVPQTPAYDASAASYNLASPPRPAFAATVTSRDQARAAVAEATSRSLGLRVLTTGHAADSVLPFDGEALIKVSLEEPVRIDVDARTATVPAGALWRDVVHAAAPHGLAALHGSSGTVGVVGYLLGGGLSFYGRRFGVASNSVRALTLLTADGRVLGASAAEHPDLFWALRGGGGGFGVVLDVTIDLFPVSRVFTGASFFTVDRLRDLLDVYNEWADGAPDAMSTSFRIMNLPPVPGVPPVLAGRPIVCVDGTATSDGTADALTTASNLLDALRAVDAPLLETWHLAGPEDALETHMDPPDPMPFVADHLVVSTFDEAARAAFATLAGPSMTSHLTFVELRQLGGAFGRGEEGGGVIDHVEGAYAVLAGGAVMSPESAGPVLAQLAAVRELLSPWDVGVTVPTFVSSHAAPQRSFDANVAARVSAIRSRVDPAGIFAGGIAPGALPAP